MKSLRVIITEAEVANVAVGYFNVSDSSQVYGIWNAARELDLPI
jgi:fructose/tagatose bisphosphate aldolase